MMNDELRAKMNKILRKVFATYFGHFTTKKLTFPPANGANE
jgi:hypothetical protein